MSQYYNFHKIWNGKYLFIAVFVTHNLLVYLLLPKVRPSLNLLFYITIFAIEKAKMTKNILDKKVFAIVISASSKITISTSIADIIIAASHTL